MAITLGKLTVIVGAGFLGSVLAKDGGASKVSDFLSGALKIVFNHLQQEDPPSKIKPQNDALMAQVNSLRAELQQFASSRSVTVITGSSRSGARTYAMPILVIGAVGYGYIWWKGWRISDLMFATRHSFSDACIAIGKQLDQVSSSLTAAKRHLSSRIDRVDANLDECTALTAATKDEVSQLRGDLSTFVVDIESVHHAVQCLETKIGRIEEKQDFTNDGVHQLCVFVQQLAEGRHAGSTQGSPSSSSRPALESPSVLLSTSRTISLPSPRLAIEPACTSQETPKISRSSQNAALASGLKDLQEISNLTMSSELEEAPNGAVVSESRSNVPSNSSSSSGLSGWRLPVLNASFITRTRSATYSFR
ncbi:uncharacterized protein LOC116258161 [Nymphaea colorata]|nr:uncharacterized protein LOC116258161 [Nymphaea colorata]